MQAEEMIGLMNSPNLFNKETMKDLHHLTDEYPYFQTAQLLYTLNLHVNKDTRFNSALRKAACYVGDRKKLLYLVEKKFFLPEIIEKIEKNDEPDIQSSFDLIDFFLSKEGEKPNLELKKITETQIISTDYVSSYLLSDNQRLETEAKPMQYQQTIDKFLEKDKKTPVRIELKKNENEEEIAFPPFETTCEESFFSVTLAKIYIKQKKYEKSLEIIRKLNLLYPEKNLYFADQIRFLEKLIINTKNKT
jgi:hypothetical protein